MSIIHDAGPAVNPRAAALEHVREAAAIHQAACRYRRQGLACSTCVELANLKRRLGCQVCGEPHGVSVPCGFRGAV